MRLASAFLLFGGLLAGSACLGNSPPRLDPVTDQMAFVDREFTLSLHATDEDDDELEFSFGSDIAGISTRATIEPGDDGRALFRWTPISSDRAPSPIHSFDFTVSDGEAAHTITVGVTVGLPGEGSSSPVFVQPLGTGTTIDLELQPCIDLAVEVQDPDSADVTIEQGEPLIDTASMEQLGPLSGQWHWCPTAEQIAEADRYVLTLMASDHENPATLKSYLLVLRTGNKPDCPGQEPVVSHSPADHASVVDLTVTATVSDDLGIKYEPLFYYATIPPGSPPDVTAMTQLTMTLASGDMQNGVWTATVPNPVANLPAGSSAQLYYVIVAQDNDDAEGSCDHVTQAPAEGVFQITVTNPGGSGNLAPCDRCSADVQCGGPGGHCIYLEDGYYCFRSCSDSIECGDEYYCSYSSFVSVDGFSGRHCIPNSYQCEGGGGCSDDSFEENDSLAQAQSTTPLGSGNYTNLTICPGYPSGDDEDWYRLAASGPTRVEATLSGGTASDLDLELRTSSDTLVARSDSLSSNESIDACVETGSYFLRVYAWSGVENDYSLGLTLTSGSCSSCVDDGYENDDSATEARWVDLNQGAFRSAGNQICSDDDDWYEVEMFAGETLYATLTFTQTVGTEDLDVYVYRNGVNLSGCSESTPSECDPSNGASGTSNETLAWPIETSGTYHLVVHGWAGSENDYDICIGYQNTHCS